MKRNYQGLSNDYKMDKAVRTMIGCERMPFMVNGKKYGQQKKELLQFIDRNFDVTSWNYDKGSQKLSLRIPAGGRALNNIQIML